MDRRKFLQYSGGTAAGLFSLVGLGGCASTLVEASPPGDQYYPRPGLQLFTVMTLLDRDFYGTLKTVAEIGYRQVETMGAFNRDPTEVRATFDRLGLVSPSQHLMPGSLYADFALYNRGGIGWDEIIRRFIAAFDFARVEQFVTEAIGRASALGQSYIVWQMNWQKGYGVEEAKKHINAFNLAGQLCRNAGLTFAVHNHDLEFAPLDGSTAYDMIVQNTDPDLVKLEMDFMWATAAGVDPVAYF